MKGYLHYVGMSDRVLYESHLGSRVGWVGFFDWDLPWFQERQIAELAEDLHRSIVCFRSGAGFHFVALNVTDWAGKVRWFDAWNKLISLTGDGFKSDYILQRDNVLRLNAKNGRRPHYEDLFYAGTLMGSGWHLRRIYRNCGSHFNVVAATWSPRLKTTGRIKIYTSDPNGVFDLAAAEMSRMSPDTEDPLDD